MGVVMFVYLLEKPFNGPLIKMKTVYTDLNIASGLLSKYTDVTACFLASFAFVHIIFFNVFNNY